MLHPSRRTRPLCPPLHEQLAPGRNLAPANPPLRHSRSDSCPDWWTELEEVGQQTCSGEEVEQDSHANISSASRQQTDDVCLHGVGPPRGLQQIRCSLAEALQVSATELRQIISQNRLKYIFSVQILSSDLHRFDRGSASFLSSLDWVNRSCLVEGGGAMLEETTPTRK